jgi:hypothetical protein
MNQWITDRLPTVEDAVHYCVLLWDQDEGVLIWSYDGVNEGQPWMPIPTPAPYVKPKRWAVKWYEDYAIWCLLDEDVVVLVLDKNLTTAAAQRIADVYNEVMP